MFILAAGGMIPYLSSVPCSRATSATLVTMIIESSSFSFEVLNISMWVEEGLKETKTENLFHLFFVHTVDGHLMT